MLYKAVKVSGKNSMLGLLFLVHFVSCSKEQCKVQTDEKIYLSMENKGGGELDNTMIIMSEDIKQKENYYNEGEKALIDDKIDIAAEKFTKYLQKALDINYLPSCSFIDFIDEVNQENGFNQDIDAITLQAITRENTDFAKTIIKKILSGERLTDEEIETIYGEENNE